MKKFVLMIVCSSSALWLAPNSAHALGPADVEAGAKVGVGIPLNTEPNTILGLGFGLGGRVGVTLFNVYAGVAGVYYFGQTKTNLGITESLHTLMLGLEAGYDFKPFPLLTLRPQLGLGNQEYYAKTEVSPSGSDSSYFYLEPAIVGLIPLENVYVGADVGTRILPAGPAMSVCPDGPGTCHSFHIGLTLHAQAGVRF